MLGFNLQEQNFLGSGNTVGIGINKNIYSESYNISFLIHMLPKMLLVLDIIFILEKLIMENLTLQIILSNSQGFGMQFGYPISDTQRINLG